MNVSPERAGNVDCIDIRSAQRQKIGHQNFVLSFRSCVSCNHYVNIVHVVDDHQTFPEQTVSLRNGSKKATSSTAFFFLSQEIQESSSRPGISASTLACFSGIRMLRSASSGMARMKVPPPTTRTTLINRSRSPS